MNGNCYSAGGINYFGVGRRGSVGGKNCSVSGRHDSISGKCGSVVGKDCSVSSINYYGGERRGSAVEMDRTHTLRFPKKLSPVALLTPKGTANFSLLFG